MQSTVIGIIKNEKYKGDLLLGKTFTVDPISKRRLENLERKINFISVTITKQLSVRRYLKKHRRYLQKEMLIVVYIRKVRSGTNLAGNMLLAV